jgi:RNA polymerase sigma-70 factor (ECF subfamily)
MQLAYHKVLEEIIEGCIKNDRLSQKQLYERLYGKMMGVCMRYANDKDQATEMLNSGFFKVFNTIGSYQKKTGTGIEAWIYRIMINTAIDYIRRDARHQHEEIGHTIYIADGADVVSTLSTAEIMALINKLSPAYRAVFNLYVVEGYNHNEIGTLLGISEGTSKSNLAKARAKLQEMIIQQKKVKTTVYGRESKR